MGAKIIVADDSQTIQKVIRISFAQTEFERTEVTSDAELLKHLSEETYDLVLLDYNLSDKRSGSDLAKEIIKISPQIKIIAMLGTFDTVDDGLLDSSGIRDKIVKPFESAKLIEKCKQLLSKGLPDPQELEPILESDEEDGSGGWTLNSPMSDDVSAVVPDKVEVAAFSDDDVLNKDALKDQLQDWGMEVPSVIGQSSLGEEELPPIISVQKDPDEFPAPIQMDVMSNIDIQSYEREIHQAIPKGEQLEYPEVLNTQNTLTDVQKTLTSKLISAKELLQDNDTDDMAEGRTDSNYEIPKDITSLLKKEVEKELSPDEFWAADEVEVSDNNTSEIQFGIKMQVQDLVQDTMNQQIKQREGVQKVQVDKVDSDKMIEEIKDKITPIIEELVAKYCKETVERVAWEIIPDLAENLIKKELKEISKSLE